MSEDITWIINTFHDFKVWGPSTTCMFTCIGILPCYDEYGCVHYDIYIRYDISLAPFPL